MKCTEIVIQFDHQANLGYVGFQNDAALQQSEHLIFAFRQVHQTWNTKLNLDFYLFIYVIVAV